MHIQFTTRSAWKLHSLVEVLRRYSKKANESIIWILRDSCLCGLVVDDTTHNILFRIQFAFDESHKHETVQFKINDLQFVQKLNKIKKNKYAYFLFKDTQLSLIRDYYTSSLAITTSDEVLPNFNTTFEALARFDLKTSDFTRICNDYKTATYMRMSVDANIITFEGLDNAFNVQESCCIETVCEHDAQVFSVTIKMDLLIPWRKTLDVIVKTLTLCLSPNYFCINAKFDQVVVELCHIVKSF